MSVNIIAKTTTRTIGLCTVHVEVLEINQEHILKTKS